MCHRESSYRVPSPVPTFLHGKEAGPRIPHSMRPYRLGPCHTSDGLFRQSLSLAEIRHRACAGLFLNTGYFRIRFLTVDSSFWAFRPSFPAFWVQKYRPRKGGFPTCPIGFMCTQRIATCTLIVACLLIRIKVYYFCWPQQNGGFAPLIYLFHIIIAFNVLVEITAY